MMQTIIHKLGQDSETQLGFYVLLLSYLHPSALLCVHVCAAVTHQQENTCNCK